MLASCYGLTPATIYNWKPRDTLSDHSHTPHQLQTTQTPTREAGVVHLRRTFFLQYEHLLAIPRGYMLEAVSHLGRDRCMRRHGIGNLKALKPPTPKRLTSLLRAMH